MSDLRGIYDILLATYGPQHWWPAETSFEVVIGAFLTQNTNWNNVEKAIANLKQAQALSHRAVFEMPTDQLEELIRPAGFFRQKAERLQGFCRHLQEHYRGSLDVMLQQPTSQLRSELLSLKGIGPETADSILLYAGQHRSFVVDAYTRRLFSRIGILQGTENYAEIRALFMAKLPAEVELYNEYHALIVQHCKQFCRTKPLCPACPLAELCCYPKALT